MSDPIKDILKSICGIICSVLLLVFLIWGLVSDKILTGIFLAALCGALAFYLLNSQSEETKRAVEENLRREREQKAEGYRCPNCGCNSGHKMGMVSKGTSVAAFGLASNKVGKSYKCSKCGYMW